MAERLGNIAVVLAGGALIREREHGCDLDSCRPFSRHRLRIFRDGAGAVPPDNYTRFVAIRPEPAGRSRDNATLSGCFNDSSFQPEAPLSK